MSTLNDGGPAFPNTQNAKDWDDWDKGMTLRDYFAAKAMAAIVTSQPDFEDVDVIARAAYAMADAMLKARKTNGSKA